MKKFLQLLIMVWLVLSLPVITATTSNTKQGHFVFSKGSQDITQLSLKPGDSGTFTIKNTGTADISDFWVNHSPSTVNILNNNGIGAGAIPCPLKQNAKKTLIAKKSCEVGYSVLDNAGPEYLTLIPFGDGADNSSTAMLKINISTLGHAVFRNNNQQITHLDLKPGDTTTFELYNAGGAAITDLRLLGLPSGMTFDSKCSGQSASLPAGVSCTITYNVPNGAKKNTFTLTVTGDPSSIDNSGSAVLTINIIPANTGHFVFLNGQGQHIDSLYLQPGDSGSIKLHNAGNAEITDVRLQGVSQNIYMNCPNTHVTQNELKTVNTSVVFDGFMYQARDGTIYVGTYSQGFTKLNTATNGLDDVQYLDMREGFIYQTRDGTIYVGTAYDWIDYNYGLKKLNAARDGLEPVEANKKKTERTNVVNGFMYQTRDGTIYVGTTEEGLTRLNAARDGLEPVEANKKKTERTNVVKGFMYQTRDGTIYVGTENEGLKKLNDARDGLEPVEANKTTDVKNGFMYQTRDGTIYVGTAGDKGLKKLNATRDGLEPVEINKTTKTSVVVNGFMYQTRDGTIYVGTYHHGLKKLNAARDGLEPVEANKTTDVKNGFMYQALDGTIYVGTTDKGLKKLPYTVNRNLASDSDCIINYFIPKGITIKKTSFLTAYGNNADNSGTAALPVTISPADSQGHFVFENGNGKSITNLDLKPGDSGVVLLRNVGKADIGNVKLDGLLASAPPHFVSKCLPSGQNQPSISLKSGDGCTFFYSVANGSPNTKFALSPTGINADNNGTARLTVNVSSNGHFVFRNTAGNNVNKLYLKPDDKGTVVLHNTGQADITNLTLKPTGNTIISQTSSTCFSANTLKTGGSCTIDYAVPAAVSAAETFTMTAKGTNADNNDIELPVTVSKEANLVFRNLSGQVITHLDLNVGQNTGTILLQNTGGTAVTNLTQTGLPPVTIGTCFLKFGGTYLGPGSSCSVNYGTFNIAHPVTLTAIGHISDKTVTATLIINTYAEKGHFVFSKDGHSITQLSLKPGDSGTFTVQNSGIVDISDFWVNQLSSTVNILNNNGVGASASPCPLNQNAKTTLTAKTSCEVGYKVPPNADPDYLTLIPLGDGADNSSTAMLKINISKLGHAIFRQKNQQITHLDLKPGDATTFELYNAGGAAITDLRLLGLPPGMAFDGKCSEQSAFLPSGNSCTTTYIVPSNAKKNIFTLTATGNPYSSDNSGSAVLTINIIPATGHFIFLNNQGQHIDSLRLQPGDSGSIQLHNDGNIDITHVRLQGVSQNIYMDCPKTDVNQSTLQNLNAIVDVQYGFIYQTRDGTVYVGAPGNGIKKLNTARNGLDPAVSSVNIWSGFMYQTQDGTIYVGTTDKGLKKLNAARDGLEPVDAANKIEKTSVMFGFMYQTRDGTIYVGTQEGLKKLNATRDGLEPVEANKTTKTSVLHGFMYQTRDGTIYVGTEEGLKKLNATKDGLEPVEANKTTKTSVSYGFMYQTRDRIIYVGTEKKGLQKLNAARDGLEPVEANKTTKISVNGGFIYQTRDGAIYVGTEKKGLQKLNAARDGLEPIEANKTTKKVDSGFMYQTWDGTIYVGTSNGGLQKLPQTVNRTLTQASDFNSDCTINYFIPKGITIKKTSVLTVYGDNADNSGAAVLPVTISPAVNQGHFVFESSDGKHITNLDLKPGDSGTILLRNVGKADIFNVKLDGLLAPNQENFVSNCFPSDQNQFGVNLKPGGSCTFVYRIADESPNTNFILSPTGIGADNNGTARLTVNVSSAGHFVFRNTDGSNVNKLYLKPDDKGTVVLHNTGQADITHFTLTPKSASGTIISQADSTCLSATTLKAGKNCTIDYAVPTAASATAETFTLTAKGTNTDNNGTAELPVTVSKEANLVFRNLSGQVINHLDLNVGQNTGTILLQNTGGTAVTNLTQTGLPSATMGTCFLKFGGTYLGPGSSCSINYGPLTKASPVTLTATDHVSGKTVTATLTISVTDDNKGHFAFRDSEGNNITALNLKAGSKGRFTIYNTGRENIFGFKLDRPSLPAGIHFTGSCFYKRGLLLKAGCVVDYAISDTYTAAKNVEIKAHTDDTTVVDINDVILPIKINGA